MEVISSERLTNTEFYQHRPGKSIIGRNLPDAAWSLNAL
jgi:hypothetical protein